MLTLYDLSVNGVLNPRFVPCDKPRFGWKLRSDREGVYQKSYSVTLSGKNQVYWESGEVFSGRSVEIECPSELPAREDLTLCVCVTDNSGVSARACIDFSTALRPEDWKAKWIKPSAYRAGWAPYLRTRFRLEKREVRTARLYIAGLGCGEYTLNGCKITEDLIDPPMTNYEREVLYRVYDIKPYLRDKNAFVALLGEGWYAQSQVWGRNGAMYGEPCLLAQAEIVYDDGSVQYIVTNDADWHFRFSPVSRNNLYAGETYDCRLEIPDEVLYGGTDEGWERVILDPVPKGAPVFCSIPPVRVVKELPTLSVRAVNGVDDGAWIFDMGENIAGVAEFHMPPSPAGHQYVFRFAENISPEGTLDVRSTGAFATQCIQQDEYISRGDPQGEVWRPRFTYHAFRYIEVTGFHYCDAYGTEPGKDFTKAYMLSTDLLPRGSFSSSHEDLNRLHRIMTATFLSNYHGYPEDCPGREKCGWLGDAQIVCNYGIMNFGLQACYEKYLHDIRTQTEVYGRFEMIAPGKRGCGEATPLWGCAEVLIPYFLYRYYGDEYAVRENWDLMKKWVEHEEADAKDYIITRGLGDWCPPCGHDSPRRIPVEESSTQMFYEIALRMSELCAELGFEGKEHYDELAANIKNAYIGRYWNADLHRYSTWGSSGVALMTGLYPEGEKENLTAELLRQIKEDDYAMPTGIYGNKYLIPALCEAGSGDTALEILFNRRHTSFGTMLDDGATSLWEGLEMKFSQPRERHTSSYNHPMHSGFAYFYYAYIGGIRPLKPGFSEFLIEPCFFEGITSAEVTHESPYGKIGVSYCRANGETDFTLTVPENTTARFRFMNESRELSSGTHHLKIKTE